MMFIELALMVIYLCVLLIKACNSSAAVCNTFGFGESASGERMRPNPPGIFAPMCSSYRLFLRRRGIPVLHLLWLGPSLVAARHWGCDALGDRQGAQDFLGGTGTFCQSVDCLSSFVRAQAAFVPSTLLARVQMPLAARLALACLLSFARLLWKPMPTVSCALCVLLQGSICEEPIALGASS